ncbi:MBL fold metallo-hydrolase [Thalassotalea agarivorans]|uniref:Glyoxylase, beta-lactamase superfamily II n=1 Tax=Thalassotalea agarivorans TaxID=349064 RepID=A0A1H9Z8N3_THASX|nr:MBL fold metallo-hydrolase [Thalassotalea agarivorans]SES77879.1 Glyoxylase, beta-lactamase superfamily II [Thalassotalea agarivorans]
MLKRISQLLVAGLLLSSAASAQDMSEVKIEASKVAGNVYMLKGRGGNIGVLSTNEGLVLVDDQFQALAEKIEAAMKQINDKPLKYVINTHFHGDHTGSNAYFAEKAPIFAHENVRARLAADERVSAKALPVVTYEGGVTIYLDNEEIQLTHLPSGHTDGDTVVYFKKANVLHTGDLFFELGFPFIDINRGGNVRGYLKNVKYMIDNTPDNVVIIPGHGKITDKDGLKAFAQMIEDCIVRVEAALKAGKSEADILAMGVEEKYKSKSWAFINEERWLKTLVAGLQ